jgi:ketosteroid isomerase-like protein
MMNKITVLLMLLLVGIVFTTTVNAGDAEDVKAAVLAVDAAYNDGNAEVVAQYLHPNHTRFPAPGTLGAGLLVAGFDKDALAARFKAGFDVNITSRHLEIAVFGNTAIATGYNEGTVTQPDGEVTEEISRFSEIWIKEGGSWKRVHIHSSPLEIED